ncbi:acyl CoA binding protein [Zalerion maritima]|uniref:Acyl CoA binding protein n=1 Tax=Zalerion maritima TaxID=339359 RepID=A0AAD5WS60_9PEZI|nr:acyl CoA binding protein [Zalerion maritima]
MGKRCPHFVNLEVRTSNESNCMAGAETGEHNRDIGLNTLNWDATVAVQLPSRGAKSPGSAKPQAWKSACMKSPSLRHWYRQLEGETPHQRVSNSTTDQAYPAKTSKGWEGRMWEWSGEELVGGDSGANGAEIDYHSGHSPAAGLPFCLHRPQQPSQQQNSSCTFLEPETSSSSASSSIISKTVPNDFTSVLACRPCSFVNMSVAQSEAFKTAIADSKKLTSKPSNEDLLDLYALFKVGNGEDYSAAPAPGMFDLKGKAKKNAWQKIVEEGITAEQAQERYVALVERMKKDYGYDESKQPEAVGA